MPAAIDKLVADVAAATAVIDSAVLLINGFADRLANGIAEALAGGATAEELAVLSELSVDINKKKQELADAVLANTPPVVVP